MDDERAVVGERLARQVEFIVEIDRLKTVLRRTLLTDRSRNENSAEHSWHLAVMALLLHEYAEEPVNLRRVLKIVLVHDLVEIDAGDTFCYDEDANRGREERERLAARRLFSVLPADQAAEMHGLWEEFEARETADARFAAALDRMQPLLSNLATGGHSWRKHGVALEQVLARTAPIGDASADLWEYMRERLAEAVDNGILDP
ncbi:MAG: HD domain-containing protein [Acidobacteriota bacterium]|nr:HD domain-containing protein [Acidobacteriota bacterium]